MRRAEAPSSLDERPSNSFVIQTLQRLTREKGDTVAGDDPQRVLAIMIKRRHLEEPSLESEQFKAVEFLVPPSEVDLIGK